MQTPGGPAQKGRRTWAGKKSLRAKPRHQVVCAAWRRTKPGVTSDETPRTVAGYRNSFLKFCSTCVARVSSLMPRSFASCS